MAYNSFDDIRGLLERNDPKEIEKALAGWGYKPDGHWKCHCPAHAERLKTFFALASIAEPEEGYDEQVVNEIIARTSQVVNLAMMIAFIGQILEIDESDEGAFVPEKILKAIRANKCTKKTAESIRNLSEIELSSLFVLFQYKEESFPMDAIIPMVQASYWQTRRGLFFALMGMCVREPEISGVKVIPVVAGMSLEDIETAIVKSSESNDENPSEASTEA